jgi:hypothetical protein
MGGTTREKTTLVSDVLTALHDRACQNRPSSLESRYSYMNQRLLTALLFGFAAVFLASLPAAAAPLRPDENLRLPSGRVAKILSISKIEYSKGVMALMVRYQTMLSVDERKALSQEVDDVWKIAQKDADRYGYTEAIISSNEVPKGIFITANRMLNFIFEKGADGKWTRLNRADFMAAQ